MREPLPPVDVSIQLPNVYSGIQMNKDNLNKATSLCYQYKAAIGSSLYAILNLQ